MHSFPSSVKHFSWPKIGSSVCNLLHITVIDLPSSWSWLSSSSSGISSSNFIFSLIFYLETDRISFDETCPGKNSSDCFYYHIFDINDISYVNTSNNLFILFLNCHKLNHRPKSKYENSRPEVDDDAVDDMQKVNIIKSRICRPSGPFDMVHP